MKKQKKSIRGSQQGIFLFTKQKALLFIFFLILAVVTVKTLAFAFTPPLGTMQLGPGNGQAQPNQACSPRLSCLNNIPPCNVKTPPGGWCPPTASDVTDKELQLLRNSNPMINKALAGKSTTEKQTLILSQLEKQIEKEDKREKDNQDKERKCGILSPTPPVPSGNETPTPSPVLSCTGLGGNCKQVCDPAAETNQGPTDCADITTTCCTPNTSGTPMPTGSLCGSLGGTCQPSSACDPATQTTQGQQDCSSDGSIICCVPANISPSGTPTSNVASNPFSGIWNFVANLFR